MRSDTADLALVLPPRHARSFRDTRQQPHLGLAYLGGFLLREGISCRVVDAHTFDRSIQSVIDEVASLKPRCVGISSTSEDRFNAIALIKGVKNRLPDAVTVGGGPHFGHSSLDALEKVPELDFAISGDGEEALLELLGLLAVAEGRRDFGKVDGLSWRAEGLPVKNRRRQSFPGFEGMKPAWELFEMDRYRGSLTLSTRTRSIGVISSRGCPSHCTFCSNSLNRDLRYKKPATFVSECAELLQRYGFEGLNIQDDSFTVDPAHVRGVCEEILRHELRFKWYCSLRVDGVQRDMLGLMKEAGCVGLGFGVESCSNRVLRKIAKGTTREMIFEAVQMVVDVGFEDVGLFVMTSLPGESEETFLESQRGLNQLYAMLRPDWVRQPVLGSMTLIYPGTPMELLAKRRGLLKQDFSWNSPYQNEKARIFGTNRFLPYYENPDFPIESILEAVRRHFKGSEIYIC